MNEKESNHVVLCDAFRIDHMLLTYKNICCHHHSLQSLEQIATAWLTHQKAEVSDSKKPLRPQPINPEYLLKKHSPIKQLNVRALTPAYIYF